MNASFKRILLVTLISCFVTTASAYKPVVIVHGIWDVKTSLDFMADRIRELHPSTNVTIIDALHGIHSLGPMWKQVETFGAVIRSINQDHPAGIHIIGYSQGGLICRGIIESMSDLKVKTFVSLSSPQGGQFGDSFLRLIFSNLVKETVHRVFYSAPGQRWSVANYWKDPHHTNEYITHSRYLPFIDNIKQSPNSTQFKMNFLRLRKLVLIGGPDDGVITPWQSSQFSSYNDNETVVPMIERDVYNRDLFGLQTLHNKKRIFTYTMAGVNHHAWHHDLDVIDNFILPHLN